MELGASCNSMREQSQGKLALMCCLVHYQQICIPCSARQERPHMRDPWAAISRIQTFIRGDLEEIALPKDRHPRSSFPAIMTCFSGMDFLGALLYKLSERTATKKRISKFLQGPMSQIDGRYQDIAEDLYEMLRKPLVHCGTIAGYFLVESDESFRELHLTRYVRDSREFVVLHTATFVEHFLAAAEAAQETLHNRPQEELTRLLDAILSDLHEPPPIPSSAHTHTSWETHQPPPNTKGTCSEDTPGWFPPHSDK